MKPGNLHRNGGNKRDQGRHYGRQYGRHRFMQVSMLHRDLKDLGFAEMAWEVHSKQLFEHIKNMKMCFTRNTNIKVLSSSSTLKDVTWIGYWPLIPLQIWRSFKLESTGRWPNVNYIQYRRGPLGRDVLGSVQLRWKEHTNHFEQQLFHVRSVSPKDPSQTKFQAQRTKGHGVDASNDNTKNLCMYLGRSPKKIHHEPTNKSKRPTTSTSSRNKATANSHRSSQRPTVTLWPGRQGHHPGWFCKDPIESTAMLPTSCCLIGLCWSGAQSTMQNSKKNYTTACWTTLMNLMKSCTLNQLLGPWGPWYHGFFGFFCGVHPLDKATNQVSLLPKKSGVAWVSSNQNWFGTIWECFRHHIMHVYTDRCIRNFWGATG